MIDYKPSKTRIELDPAERMECMRLGMHLKAAEAGVSVSELAAMLGFSKEAQAAGNVATGANLAGAAGQAMELGGKLGGGAVGAFKNIGAGVVITSAMLGIPIGVVSHMMDRAMTKRRAKEQQLLEEADYYDDAARSLSSSMAAKG
jgi:hypothetical protein